MSVLIMEYIDSCRKEKGLTKSELAKKAYMSPGAYTHYLTGRTSPSIDTIMNLMQILDIDKIELIRE